jgi:hypothetical protein
MGGTKKFNKKFKGQIAVVAITSARYYQCQKPFPDFGLRQPGFRCAVLDRGQTRPQVQGFRFAGTGNYAD